MTLLISTTDFANYRHISANIDSAKIEPYIYEAQQFDVRPALGDALYYDLLKHSTETNYSALLDGEDYSALDGYDRHFDGLKSAIVYFAYARYIESANLHSTPLGFVAKRNDYSTEPSDKTIARQVTAARESAKGYLSDALMYLDAKRSDFPLYGKTKTSTPSGGIKITRIGGDDIDSDGYEPRSLYPLPR